MQLISAVNNILWVSDMVVVWHFYLAVCGREQKKIKALTYESAWILAVEWAKANNLDVRKLELEGVA